MVHADLNLVLCWRNHANVRRFMYTKHEITLDEHQRWFERSIADPIKHLFIFELNHQARGFINFTETGQGGIADWGFYVAPDAPKGSGQKLGHAALYYAFSRLRFHKVCGRVLVYNEHSLRFHRSLGFEQEGIMRDQHFDGERYHDVILFGLISSK